jgi:endonuclease/exonuclease/phosphatase family metal-dependent hydrolase
MTDAALLGPVEAPALSVMTWNVRRLLPATRRSSPDSWERRRGPLRGVLRRARPHVLCVQEAERAHLDWIRDSLGHGWIGRGRDADGGGEHCAVLHDPSRLRLERWHQYALSRTPDAAGSRSWAVLWPRVFVVAEFTDLATAGRFRVVNTHLDPFSPWSRRRSAELLREAAAGRRHPFDTVLPTLLTGDMNSGPSGAPYRALTAQLVDTWATAARRASPEWRTYSRYRPPQPGRRIDWVLATPDIVVEAAAIAAVRVEGVAPSDHEPVQAIVRLPVSGAR